ncbi:MAG: peptide chain release factor 3 [Hyphomicrobiaceae bacterium]
MTDKVLQPEAGGSAGSGGLGGQVSRRRTFAIISHPDAGKTTLTEKLLLFGGAIQLAGQVKAKKDKRGTRSDWMAIERARGISVATSVMTFEYGGAVFNLLDTPGHEDFSDHTYRTLTAVDSAIMVIDGARGIEARTRKLFEICRLRDIPIITFVNKMDRESREPLELLDEIETTLALETAPMVWPIGRGRDFRGTFDLAHARVRQLDQSDDGTAVSGLDDPLLATLLAEDQLAHWREEMDLVEGACGQFELEPFRQGTLTPVFFGSALRNFGVRDLLDALIAHAPPPRSQPTSTRIVEADEKAMTGLVFKIQANMDPAHRDRIAFMRVCSGKLTRGMKVRNVRTGRQVVLQAPQFFFAQDRSLAEEAFAGDIVGLPNKGLFRIGDTLTEGESLTFVGIPSFAPEILRRVRLEDAIRAKKLREALAEMAEEGVVQLFSPLDGSPPIVGVIGALQLDVLGNRLANEYGLTIAFEAAPCDALRWVLSGDPKEIDTFVARNRSSVAIDTDGDYVYLAPSSFYLDLAIERNPGLRFADIKTSSAPGPVS